MAENAADVAALMDAKNFLYLINSDRIGTREEYLAAVAATNYDLVLVDAFFEEEPLTAENVARLKRKANGGSRLVLAYVNIGAAEDYRYYWQPDWRIGDPPWLAAPYDGYEDEIFVEYWSPEWQAIIFGSPEAYIDRVLAAGFDGAYLDNVLAYEEFEDR